MKFRSGHTGMARPFLAARNWILSHRALDWRTQGDGVDETSHAPFEALDPDTRPEQAQ